MCRPRPRMRSALRAHALLDEFEAGNRDSLLQIVLPHQWMGRDKINVLRIGMKAFTAAEVQKSVHLALVEVLASLCGTAFQTLRAARKGRASVATTAEWGSCCQGLNARSHWSRNFSQPRPSQSTSARTKCAPRPPFDAVRHPPCPP